MKEVYLGDLFINAYILRKRTFSVNIVKEPCGLDRKLMPWSVDLERLSYRLCN